MKIKIEDIRINDGRRKIDEKTNGKHRMLRPHKPGYR